MGPGPKLALLALPFTLALGGCAPSSGAAPPAWTEREWQSRVLDAAHGGRAAIADVDGDGWNDVVLHEWRTPEGEDGSLAWYDARTGERHEVARDPFFGDALVAADLDGDGDVDIVAPHGSYGHGELYAYLQEGGEWRASKRWLVDREGEVKDLEVLDLDQDGRVDVVARTMNRVAIYFGGEGPPGGDGWVERALEVRPREGLALGDLDGDGDEDLVLNGFWLETPADPRSEPFVEHVVDDAWFTDDTGMWQDFSAMVATADLDRDGRLDVVFGHSEKPGVPLAWYGRGAAGAWTRHELGVVDWCHTLAVGDLDLDGWPDLLVGETKRLETASLRALVNDGDGTFTTVEIAPGASYKAALGDTDGDGDLDVVSSTSWVDAPVTVHANPARPLALDRWKRHALATLPARAPFVDAADVDGDGDKDLVAGGFWYANPGRIGGEWVPRAIGEPLRSAALVVDLDGDGHVDVLGTQGEGSAAEHRLAYARGLGGGAFQVRDDLPTGPRSDFLQGRALVPHGAGRAVLLSWHAGEGGVQRLVVPHDPWSDAWTTDEASPVTLNEDLAAADLDGDGDLDVALGTTWLRADGDGYTPLELGDVSDLEATRHAPGGVVGTDRIGLADIDGDGRVDLVAGCEGAQEILWFQRPVDAAQPWPRHVLARVPGEGYSLAVRDMDLDGDPDVVVGEHRGERNRVLILENAKGDGSNFLERVVDEGRGDIDHHDGTLPVDLDGDGDLDLVSIGWTHPRLWVFENRAW